MATENPLAWYQEGLRFQCTECGKCCTGGPGYVWVTPEEMEEIAQILELDLHTFCQKYVRKIGERYALKERTNWDCVFLKGKRCTVYKVRPKQCRTFPWWDGVLRSKESWEETGSYCEGINDEAPLVSFDEIERVRQS
ncbi:MAG: YkgJ family cysteine cluster protein [Parachlamydiales bacterium]